MDIHKPKPWHSLREFLKEYVIIVVGVLTALAAEQGVEWLHWRHKVDDATQRLNVDLRAVDHFALERAMIEPCLDRRLNELSTQLLASSGQWSPLAPMSSPVLGTRPYFVPSREWANRVWESVISDGTATHLPSEMESRYAVIYTKAALASGYNTGEFVEVGAFNVLNMATDLPRSDRLRLAAQIEQERVRNKLLALMSRQLMLRIGEVGAHDQAKSVDWVLHASNTYRACAALNLLPPGSPPPLAAGDPMAYSR